MRFLLSTIGSRGDVQPLVALGLQLKALGQQARLCVPPDFCDWTAAFGLEAIPIGPEVRTATMARQSATTPPPTAEALRQLIDATVAIQFERITSAADGCGAIVAATALQVAAASVAEHIGVPYVFAAYSPNVLPSPHHGPPLLPPAPGEGPVPPTAGNRELWARNADRMNATFRGALNAHRVSRGMVPVDDVSRYMFTDRPWLAADPAVAPWPDPADGVFQTGAWILSDDRPLPRELEMFLDAGDAPVYFGFSSMPAPQDLGVEMVAAARALGRRAIVSRGWADLTAVEGARDCLTVGEVNLHTLLARVAAAVHHGGAGTTTLAALAGAPQVVVPQIYDQPYFARRVDDLGIGSAHATGMPTRESLRIALERALRPEVAARAREIGGAVRRDGARVSAERLVDASR